MKIFGKPLGNLPAFKRNLVESNATALERSLKLATAYKSQPKRNKCKLCEHLLPESPLFIHRGVPYMLCKACGHINGGHSDTSEYANEVYIEQDYGATYRANTMEEYCQRVDEIYVPKANFLINALAEAGESATGLSVTDFGAGSGHFLAALSSVGIPSMGFEISNAQTAFANEMLAAYPLAKIQPIDIKNINYLAETHNAPISSLIGVLEHLENPLGFLDSMKKNKNTHYLYMSLPLFSLSVYLETAFPHIAPRVLEGGHTHLFTPESIKHLEKRYGWNRIGEWWFGLDIFDLFRTISISLSGNTDTQQLSSQFHNQLSPLADQLQLLVDQHSLCSEVHLLYSVRNATGIQTLPHTLLSR